MPRTNQTNARVGTTPFEEWCWCVTQITNFSLEDRHFVDEPWQHFEAGETAEQYAEYLTQLEERLNADERLRQLRSNYRTGY